MIFSKKDKKKQDGPSHRIFNPRIVRTPKYRARRMIILCFALITLLFIGKIILSFFNFEHVTFALFGNIHYTKGQIYDVLGENLDNIVTDSELKTAKYLKENLSYIKDVQVTKNLVRRMLTIEVTERKVFAYIKLLVIDDPNTEFIPKITKNHQKKEYFFLIDQEGYVLESINPEQYGQLSNLIDECENIPEIGVKISSTPTQLGIHVLKHVRSRKPDIAKDLKSIDARTPKQIKLRIDSLPMTVWIAADMVETGLHNLSLFINQRAFSRLKKQRLIPIEKENKKLDAGSGDTSLPIKYTYLDARYKDTLYLGGANK